MVSRARRRTSLASTDPSICDVSDVVLPLAAFSLYRAYLEDVLEEGGSWEPWTPFWLRWSELCLCGGWRRGRFATGVLIPEKSVACALRLRVLVRVLDGLDAGLASGINLSS